MLILSKFFSWSKTTTESLSEAKNLGYQTEHRAAGLTLVEASTKRKENPFQTSWLLLLLMGLIGAIHKPVAANINDNASCVVEIESKERDGYFWKIVGDGDLIVEAKGSLPHYFVIESPGPTNESGTWAIRSSKNSDLFLGWSGGKMKFTPQKGAPENFTFKPHYDKALDSLALQMALTGMQSFYLSIGVKSETAIPIQLLDLLFPQSSSQYFSFYPKNCKLLEQLKESSSSVASASSISTSTPFLSSTFQSFFIKAQMATSTPVSGLTITTTMASSMVVSGAPEPSQKPQPSATTRRLPMTSVLKKYVLERKAAEKHLKSSLEKVNEDISNVSSSDSGEQFFHDVTKIEEKAMSLASKLKYGEQQEVKTANVHLIAAKSRKFVSDLDFPVKYESTENRGSSVSIPKDVLNTDINGSRTVAAVLYKGVPSDLERERFLVVSSSPHDLSQQHVRVVGDVLSVAMEPRVARPFRTNVTVRLRHLASIPKNSSVLCGYLLTHHLTSKVIGGALWATKGCWRNEQESNANYTVCACNHLTSFTVLMSVSESEFENHPAMKVLDLVSTIGCCISLAFLIIGILLLAFLFISGHHSERNLIHLNLMISLGIGQLILLFGIEQIGNRMLCRVIAYALHYFFLASFMWMLVEGINLYLMVVRVFDDGRSKSKIFTVMAWGTPAVIVAVTAGLMKGKYIASGYCWISRASGIIWAFTGPVALVVLINFVILMMVLKEIVSLSGAQALGTVHQIRSGLRSAIILLPLLGVTWVFGLVVINQHTIVLHYIFGVFNALQGFLVVVLHCFFNSEVRKAFERRKEIFFSSYSSKFLRINSITPKGSKMSDSTSGEVTSEASRCRLYKGDTTEMSSRDRSSYQNSELT